MNFNGKDDEGLLGKEILLCIKDAPWPGVLLRNRIRQTSIFFLLTHLCKEGCFFEVEQLMEACLSTEPISENVRGLVTKSQYLFLSFFQISVHYTLV